MTEKLKRVLELAAADSVKAAGYHGSIEKDVLMAIEKRLLPLLEAGENLYIEHEESECSCMQGEHWEVALEQALKE